MSIPSTKTVNDLDPLPKAVEVLFDRFEKMVPHFVPRGRALLISTTVALVVFTLGLLPVMNDKRRHESSGNIKEFRWVVALGVLTVVCYMVHSFLADTLYMFVSVAANSPHYASVFWLNKYAAALRPMFKP